MEIIHDDHPGYDLAKRLDDFYHYSPTPKPGWVIARVTEIFVATGRKRALKIALLSNKNNQPVAKLGLAA